ncbi:uncharacterized protein LOC142622533 [Castanea sativa]|uniref:uncharacterized protein LOC142622533 n=1 Tax=Castanea sativa TaxID=21020 RepID=UPI003F652AC9
MSKDWLHSEPPKRASPIWRAIEQSKKIINKGACFSIGNGSSIDIWTDPWVPWIEGFIPTPKVEEYTQLPIRVSHLINSNRHCWKQNLVKELFNPHSVQAILTIPIPTRPSLDKLIWIPYPKGNFLVKSAYHSARSHLPSLSPCEISWNKIWNLNLPKRLRILLWRIGVNVLPTKQNLLNRLQVSDAFCLFCKDNIESSSHLFFNCPASRSFWFSVYWGLKTENLAISQPEDIIKLCLNPPNVPCEAINKDQVLLRLVFTIGEFWLARNRDLHQNCSWDVSSSIRMVLTRCFEFSTIIAPRTDHALPIPVHVWSPPPFDCIKINIDAATYETQAAIAVVARDHRGVPLKVWARLIKMISLLQAETEALHWAVKLAKVEGWSKVIFEGDAKICFDAINSHNQSYQWCIQTQLLNIIDLAVCFSSCSFVWISRNCNGVAHQVARFSLISRLAFVFLLDNLPPALLALCKAAYPICSSFIQ